MAYISTFIYCLNVERISNESGESINALGIITAIEPEFLPTAFSFSVIFSILDIGEKDYNKLRLTFSDDEKTLVDTGYIDIPANEDIIASNIPNDAKGLMMSMDLKNVSISKEGYYKTTIWFDDQNLGDYRIYVKEREKK